MITRTTPFFATFNTFVHGLLALLVATLGLSTAAWAEQTAIVLDKHFTERTIGLDLSIFEDKTTQRTLADIRSAEFATQFTPSTQKNPSFGYTQSAYWARWTLNDVHTPSPLQAVVPWYLTLAYAQTDLAELWCANPKGEVVIQQRAGDHVPRAEWPTSHREPAFEIPPTAHTCWMRVQTSASMQLPLNLYTQQAFINMRLSDNAVQALYFGALLVMLVYNGLLAASTRSLAYAAYTLFLLGFGLFQSALGGIGYAYLWPDAVGWADSVTPFFISFFAINSIIFAQILLDLRQTAPRWYKFGLVLLLPLGFNLLLSWVLSYSVAIRAIYVLMPVWGVLLIGSGIYLSWRGERVAQIYLAAWLVFIVGSLSLMGSRIGWLPVNAFTVNAPQIGSAIEFVMLSFALSYRIKTLQNQLVDSVRAESASRNLAAQAQTDSMLTRAKSETQQAHNAALQVQAELARKETELAQTQLQQADKMASLGQLVASVTHEINTPIGAISSSGQSITEALSDVIAQLPPLLRQLDTATSHLLVELLLQANRPKAAISSREERVIIKRATEQLEAAGLDHARQKANFLLGFQAQDDIDKFLPLLQHPLAVPIQQAASNLSMAIGSARNVNVAVERVAKIVKALKSFSHFNIGTEKIEANLTEGMDTVLTIYQGQTRVGVEVVRNYESIPALLCFPDELNQVWTNLIHNALQAMGHEGTLTIGIRREGDNAVVSVGDSGCGIPEEIRSKIFDVFFTTKPAGVGSGLGLDIVKKIIEKHHGRIELQSEVGMGSTFSVYLPYTM